MANSEQRRSLLSVYTHMILSPVNDFQLIRISIAAIMLAISSFLDYRYRSISDLLWIFFGIVIVIIYFFDFPDYNNGILYLISIGLAAGISFGIYRCGLFGGADVLALVTLSAILPTYGSNQEGILAQKITIFVPFVPLIILTNAAILSTSQVLFNMARNFVYFIKYRGKLFEGFKGEPIERKILAIIVGYKSKGKANNRFGFAIERNSNGRKQFDFGLQPAETAEFESRDDVWVTPGLPFIIYLFGGFITMIFVGDLAALIFNILR